MTQTRILAFSSSRTGTGGYLETATPIIQRFLGATRPKIAFIPFASVDNDDEAYADMVRQGLSELDCEIVVATLLNAHEVIGQSEVVMVGGGNTFKLLHDLYRLSLLQLIRDKVRAGTPYIGWSAGSNILCPTIKTTNDMPIVAPESFNALGLLPFQINPHYFNYKIPGHNGETRDQRLLEFVKFNPELPVIGLPEGSALQLQGSILTYLGGLPAVVFTNNGETTTADRKTVAGGADLSWLLS